MPKKAIFSIIIIVLVSLSHIHAHAASRKIVQRRSELVSYVAQRNYPPFKYSQNFNLTGFDIELTNLIFNNEDYYVIYSTDEWINIYDKLKNGKIDTCGMLAVTEERKKEILFSQTVLETSISVYSKKIGKDYNKQITLRDLNRLKIGVAKGQYSEEILKKNVGISKYFAFPTVEAALDALNQGKIDVLFENQEVVNFYLVRNGLQDTISPAISNLFPVKVAYGVRKGKPELVEYINRRIDALKKTGVYEELYLKYFFTHSTHYEEAIRKEFILKVSTVFSLVIVVFIFLQLYIRRLRKKILQEQGFSNSIVNNADIMIIVWKLDGTIVSFNKFSEQITGFSAEEVKGKKWFDVIIPPEIHKEILKDYGSIVKGELSQNYENTIITKDGQRMHILWNNNILTDDSGKPNVVVSMGIDITERKIAEAEIHNLAYYDSLTGLPNRAMLFRRLDEILKQEGSFALLYLDLDNFKTINDTEGHLFGDELLKTVASKIRECIQEDNIVFRLGGDEFIVLKSCIKGLEEIKDTAEKIIRMFKQSWNINNHEFYITASIGITVFPDDGQDANTLLKNADTAMYHAKELGKNNYQVYTKSLVDKITEKLEIINSLRHAVERRELTVHYQPMVDMNNGQITGVEALIRWYHPVRGIIPPLKFIPFAEESGLITDIGEWVLSAACKQVCLWNQFLKEPIGISVNLSVCQFQHPLLVETISGILHESKLDPSFLELEITESIAMNDISFTIAVLQRLRNMGIKIALDDFGTGYSSLSYLKKLPINTLKIDKSFIHNVADGSGDEAIISTIISMAHSMKLDVVAEGVETEHELLFLKKKHCDKAQGYLFSKPLPPNEMEIILRNDCSFYVPYSINKAL